MNLNNIEVFAVSGKMGSGKDYIAKNILYPMLTDKPTIFLAFGDYLKIQTILKDNYKVEDCFIDKKTAELRKKLTSRSDFEKESNSNIYIDALDVISKVNVLKGIERIIITDVRYITELNYVKSIGGITIRVNSPNRTEKRYNEEYYNTGTYDIRNHSSETDLDFVDPSNYDLFVSNDYNDNPYQEIYNFVKDYNKKHKKDLVVFCDMDDTLIECHSVYQKSIDEIANIASHILSINKEKILVYLYDEYNSDGFLNYNWDRDKHFNHSLIALKKLCKNDNQYKRIEGMLKFWCYNEIDNISNYTKLEGAKEFLDTYKPIILTVGDKHIQNAKAAYNQLNAKVETTYDKVPAFYRNMMEKYPAHNYIMIGNSLEKDILPAMKAGIQTCIYIDCANTYKQSHTKYDILVAPSILSVYLDYNHL